LQKIYKLSPIKIRIGDIVISVNNAQEEVFLNNSLPHRFFQVMNGSSDIFLNYYYVSIPNLSLDNLIFASEGNWNLYQKGRQFIIPLTSYAMGPCPYRLAVMNEDFSRGEVYVRPYEVDPGRSPESPVALDPFEYPLDEVIMVNFLARGRGVILHACGVVDEGRGLLFVGVSGAGKSTLAELWKPTGVTLLSDDRIIVRRMEGKFRMYGTPWHGDAGIASPESAPLERLYFIEQAARNYVQALSPVDAAARLLVRCFPPFYDKAGMEFILDFLAQVAEEIPCYELGFVPDASAIDFVRGLK